MTTKFVKLFMVAALLSPLMAGDVLANCYEHYDEHSCMAAGKCIWYPGGQECVGGDKCYGSTTCHEEGCFWSERPGFCADNDNKTNKQSAIK